MAFAGINYWALLLAAVVGFVTGGIWYQLFATPWLAANGLNAENLRGPGQRSHLPMLYAFIATLVMAWVLGGVMGHLGPGQVTVKNGIISGAFCWAGFVITTMVVNNAFAKRKPVLLLIDGGYWLLVLVLMGAVIGWLGV